MSKNFIFKHKWDIIIIFSYVLGIFGLLFNVSVVMTILKSEAFRLAYMIITLGGRYEFSVLIGLLLGAFFSILGVTLYWIAYKQPETNENLKFGEFEIWIYTAITILEILILIISGILYLIGR